jgi:hypothetical protein
MPYELAEFKFVNSDLIEELERMSIEFENSSDV